MLCVRPYRVRGMEFGCYKCKACRMNRRNLMAGRMMLELTRHAHACFVTLTYKDAPYELDPQVLRNFLKRLRYYRGPFRFYGVGEYGSLGLRPHYHAALFGVSMVEEEVILKAWGLGFVHVGELNALSAKYLTKYVCKSVKDLVKIGDRHPEFARSSMRPYGIGGGATDDIAGNLMRAHGGSIEPEDVGDVPTMLRIENKRYPLGKYLRGRVRVAMGWESTTPVDGLRSYEASVLAMSKEEREVRERKRQIAYDNLEGRLRIQRSKEKL